MLLIGTAAGEDLGLNLVGRLRVDVQFVHSRYTVLL